MGTINSAFNIISGALDADQAALGVIANNVANANTTGYTEETATFQENSPVTINGANFGDGVTETGAESMRDRVLEGRIDQQQQLESSSSARLTALNTMQSLFTPDSGSSSSEAGDIGNDITNFYDAFSSLESNATSNSLRQEVLSSAQTLTSDVSNAANGLGQQQQALDQEATSVVGQVNSLSTALAQLNQQIMSTSPDADAGTLEDQRQSDLSQLSQLVGINQITTANNGLTITTTSGQVLVSQNTSNQITMGKVNGVTHFFVGTTDATSDLASGGGELGGDLTARDQDIPTALSALDNLAFTIATTVNSQQAQGTDFDGNTGADIFAEPTQVAGSAQSMSVVMTDPNGIAAAAAGAGASSGDDSNAVSLSALQTTVQSQLNGQDPNSFYSDFVTQLGSTISEVQTENTAQSASVTQLTTQRNSLSEVNLNNEASSLTNMQRSYQAASQFFTILDSVMASALNLGEETAVS
ncbi:flagellar hook-associated protein FlgK [Terracidiphilus sp.]|jgi:flagellar hook-associated protein 1 FlgK|uniref:flagellar hook-associated protein FlgK n=1 Tax=Terracidiphilus sp. TaxID=1964191 RepID=UPI003C28B704